jgi:hypothetical protein
MNYLPLIFTTKNIYSVGWVTLHSLVSPTRRNIATARMSHVWDGITAVSSLENLHGIGFMTALV